MEVCDSLWALAAFAGWILLGFAVYFIIAQRLEIERLEGLIRPWDHDGDGRPGGAKSPRVPALFHEPMLEPPRKRHDPYIER